MHPIQKIISDYNKGVKKGIYSCCCANAIVIKAAMKQALDAGSEVLIEATANQVNQFGGYTGMTPPDFVRYVHEIAEEVGFPVSRLILGGDHLGPLTWTDLPEGEAMRHAEDLVRAYAGAGFTKIHIDTSMKVASDDPNSRLSDEVIARRGARLCRAAEEAYENHLRSNPEAQKPVYVIGSEVPIPGGAKEAEKMQITTPRDCESTIETFHAAFLREDLTEAWSRVVGVVVQPGVEFGSFSVVDYDRDKAAELRTVLEKHPQLCFEAHSTDYQTAAHLRQLVEDGFLILKVGPALTFALREGMLAMAGMEQELLGYKSSHYREALEETMQQDPSKWIKYYHGNRKEQQFACIYSYSDRQRYYSGDEVVKQAQETLLRNMEKLEIPDVLLSQYMPIQHQKVKDGRLKAKPEALLCDYVIERCILDYAKAAGMGI